MDRKVIEDTVEKPKEHLFTLDLNDVEKCCSFAIEVIARLAFFGTPDGMLPRDRQKMSYGILDNIVKDIRSRLKTNMSRYEKEYDNVRDTIQGLASQADSTEQMGRTGDPDSQV